MSDVVEAPPPRGSRGNGLAIGLSLVASTVSVLAFGMGALAAARGSDVTLFPIEDAMIFGYSDPAYGNALGVSLQTEFANIASERFPDAIIDQSVEIVRGEERYSCLSARGEVHFRTTEQIAAETGPAPTCDRAECVHLQDAELAFEEGPTRRTVAAGEITSLRQVFDTLAIPAKHYCTEGGRLAPRTLAHFVQQARGRPLTFRYHADTLRDGGFDATCTVRLSDDDLATLAAQGWGFYPCIDASADRSPDTRGFWERTQDFFDNLL